MTEMHTIATVGKRYRHYKNGKEYTVIALARDSETLEELVVYRAEYTSSEFAEGAIWTRPRTVFEESVLYNGAPVQRFTEMDVSR